GGKVAHCHLRYLNPFPRNLEVLLKNYQKVLVPELNRGQLSLLLRNQFLVDAKGFNKIQGKPFLISEVADAIRSHLENGKS
ncbi:MAG TPA: 2-oxoglutarate ferredoxin oxidoreductase subunit alpha, partial [Planctomycetaceae bacterium]|nr:2-oxoglutarate ferredoxin oxidoreductase subunit alpha [Planctomycetaceae bacterium]